MIDATARKEVALEYCRRLNAGNLDSLLELFADDIRFEDPVGSPPVIGRAALRTHFARVIASRIVEEPGVPVPAADGKHVALPITAALDYLPVGPVLAAAGIVDAPANPAARRLRFDLIGVMRVGEDGLMREVRVFWGKNDVTVV
jgi:steroid Delta-isomerase